MQTKKDKTPKNEKGEEHGYWEVYYFNGQLGYKGNYINGKEDGYWELYQRDGSLMFKGNYVNGKKIGFWIESDKKYFYAN